MEEEYGWVADPRPARALLGPIHFAVYARLAVTPALSGGRLSLASLFLLI